MNRPPTQVRITPTSNSFRYNAFRTLDFTPPATPTFSTTSPLFGKQPGVYPQKLISSESPRPTTAKLHRRNPTQAPISCPITLQLPSMTNIPRQLRLILSPCTLNPVRTSISARQAARPSVRLGPRLGMIGDNECLPRFSTVKASISFCPTPNTPK